MASTSFYTTVKSPVGNITLISSGKGLSGVYLSGQDFSSRAARPLKNPKLFTKAVKQLKEYFSGKRKDFNLPLASEGTVFQKQVWKKLRAIPYGQTQSYGEVAKAIKAPKASRAVGMANNKNPLCIVVPCHRVIGANGKLTGYAGGLRTKKWLLDHEAKFSQVRLKKN